MVDKKKKDMEKIMGKLKVKKKKKEEELVEGEDLEEDEEMEDEEDQEEEEDEDEEDQEEEEDDSEEDDEEDDDDTDDTPKPKTDVVSEEVAILQNDGVFRRELLSQLSKINANLTFLNQMISNQVGVKKKK